MNLGVERLKTLLGWVGAGVGISVGVNNCTAGYEFLGSFLGGIIGCVTFYWGVHWVADGFEQSRTKREKEQQP